MDQLLPDPDVTGAYEPPQPCAQPPIAERFAPGYLLAGRYRVVAQLGKGGMGEVYRADDLTLGQPVALKFLPLHFDQDIDRITRFRKEVAAARRVSHPNVCRVYDIVQHEGHSFLTMEFIDGEDLSSVIQRLGRVPEEKGVEVARQLCSALSAVHDQGLLHRDLKPANVMLDGRGKARLTDFGLAAAVEDLSVSDVRSGTPLYQAPEQLAGQEVTVRSDLYALGLVLYELFTGRRAFPSTPRSGPPSKPSSHISGMNPAVEAIILKCLEPDSKQRPHSATEVLAHLPGGDPLAAALAAGETPSPKMVADAPAEGTLRPPVAAGMLVGIVALLLLIAGLNDRYKAHRHIPLPPPAVLEDKARSLVRNLGYTDPPRDSFSGFEMPTEHQSYMARNDAQPVVPLDQMASCRPALAVYWHRQSPQPMLPTRSAESGRGQLTSQNPPPTDVLGMVTLRMDTRGRLVEFLAVPDPVAVSPAKPTSWDAVLKLAELDAPGVLHSDPATAPTPPVFADQTTAWVGAYPERREMRIRVEAASYRGRLVFFRIVHPDWGKSSLDRPVPIVNRGSAYFAVLDMIFGFIWLGLIFFAVRNVRGGRADFRGALVVAATAYGFQGLYCLVAATHFPNWGLIVPLALNELAFLLFALVVTIASYLALEPAIRRRCPHRLTAWNRLADGRWRDPLVGRHVLIGVLAGVVCSLSFPALPFWPSPQGPSVVHPYSFTRPAAELAGDLAGGVAGIWVYAGLFGVVLTISRRDWVAVVVVASVFILGIASSGTPLLHQAFGVARLVVGMVLFLRLGILATVACNVAGNVLLQAPISLDTSAWYFGASLTYLAVLAAIAGYAGWISLGGRPLFQEGFVGDS